MATELRASSFVIAVDAGGTHTRVGCFGLNGTLLSMATGGGGNPLHNRDATENVSAAVCDALRRGGLKASNAVGLAAGMAGVTRYDSDDWAHRCYALPSLRCPRRVVNDAEVAHRGALLGEPGVIAVAGTGSMILAITHDGRKIESGQLEHYAGGARHLAFELMHRLLSGATDVADKRLVAQVLAHWHASDITDLRHIILDLETQDRNDVKRRYGALAPLITSAAAESPLADAALRTLADRTARGVQILAPFIQRRPVLVALSGGLGCDPAFAVRVRDALASGGGSPTKVLTAALDPLGGAALLAYEVAGFSLSDGLIDRISHELGAQDQRDEGDPTGGPDCLL